LDQNLNFYLSKGEEIMTTAPFTISSDRIKFPIAPAATTGVAVPPLPAAPATTGLASIAANPAARKSLVCNDLLDPEAQKHAEADASQLMPQMLENTEIMLKYGLDAVQALNALAEKLLKEVEPIDIPELEDLMEGLRREMRKIKSNWDMGDPKVAKKIQDYIKNGKRWWLGAKNLVEILMEDAMRIEQQLDRVVAELAKKDFQLTRNVNFYDQIYATNEEELIQLVYRIAVMEQLVKLAAQESDKITADPQNPADRQKAEHKRLLNELSNNMDNRVTEFDNRLFVGWSTGPQTTNMRNLDVGLVSKINVLINLVIPTMKLTIVQWRMLIQSQQAAQMEQIVAATANEWMLAYANAGASGVKYLAETVETPTLRPDTITAMAELVASQCDAILEARKNGKALRQQVSQAIYSGTQTIAAAQDRLNKSVDEIVNNTAKLTEEVNAVTA
jgi:uncharacterized protein YaaN involved in tellurite resistance